MKYWIDTDPGVDDAVAILLATKYLGNDILGFSSVQGNFIEPITARNLARIISKIKNEKISPNNWNPIISRGSQNALVGASYRESDYSGSYYHGKDGLADVNWFTEIDWQKNNIQAAYSIVATAHKYPGMSLFCIGPLTNIALALQLEPDLPKFVSEITIMGGSIYVNGNETNTAEFNFIADPEAAKIVFNTEFRNLKLIPIDPCLDVRFFQSDIIQIREKESSIAQSIIELMNNWDEKLLEESGIVIYDAVALVLSLFPELAIWESLLIDIDADHYRGKVNLLKDNKNRNTNAQVAIKVRDRDLFFAKLQELL